MSSVKPPILKSFSIWLFGSVVSYQNASVEPEFKAYYPHSAKPRGRPLASKHGATIGCPITTGIFAWIAANAAEEDINEGKKRVTPSWRTLKTGGELNPKYPGGVENLRRKLEGEGHTVVKKGTKKYFVADYEKSLVKTEKAECQ